MNCVMEDQGFQVDSPLAKGTYKTAGVQLYNYHIGSYKGRISPNTSAKQKLLYPPSLYSFGKQLTTDLKGCFVSGVKINTGERVCGEGTTDHEH